MEKLVRDALSVFYNSGEIAVGYSTLHSVFKIAVKKTNPVSIESTVHNGHVYCLQVKSAAFVPSDKERLQKVYGLTAAEVDYLLNCDRDQPIMSVCYYVISHGENFVFIWARASSLRLKSARSSVTTP